MILILECPGLTWGLLLFQILMTLSIYTCMGASIKAGNLVVRPQCGRHIRLNLCSPMTAFTPENFVQDLFKGLEKKSGKCTGKIVQIRGNGAPLTLMTHSLWDHKYQKVSGLQWGMVITYNLKVIGFPKGVWVIMTIWTSTFLRSERPIKLLFNNLRNGAREVRQAAISGIKEAVSKSPTGGAAFLGMSWRP